MDDKEMHYNLYIMAESNYKKMNEDLDENELFPVGWYSSDNYILKNKILAEAIMNNKKIIDTDKYQEMVEGVKTK